ncbi:MAG TPA: hypothetical protein VHZ97_17335 [Pseudonocardiaceae bacterium]|jgi:hypothetical protein|nr:hypothetical protein [Pseudonocardiaceae bacterium]
MISFPDLTESGEDAAILTRFHDTLYLDQYPDPDTRESLADLLDALRHKAEGAYGRDNRHIVLALLDGQVLGGASAAFLAEPNVGVLEFVVGTDDGSGRQLLTRTENLLRADAERLGRPLSAILAELTEPFPAEWGYRRLDFPYPGGKIMTAKSLRADWVDALPSTTVRAVVRARTGGYPSFRSSIVELVEFGL